MADRIHESDQIVLPAERQPPERPVAIPRPGTARKYARMAYRVAVTDALAVEGAILLARVVRSGYHATGAEFPVLLAMAPVLWVLTFAAFGLYSFPRVSPEEEFRRLVEASGIALALKLLASLAFVHGGNGPISGGWVVLTWLLALVFTLIGRKLWHRYMGRRRLRGELLYRTLIVGANEEAVRIGESLENRSLGFHPVGLVRTDFGWMAWDKLPILGGVPDLSRLIEDQGIECVFIASSAVGTDMMKRISKQLRRHNVEVRVSANLTEILASRLSLQPVGELLALSLRPVRLSGPRAAAKRSFDLVVGSVVVVLAAPLWLAVAGLVKLTSRGPVLFRQERVGQGSGRFRMYKFRTMVHGAEQLLTQLEEHNEASGPLFKMRDDPRVTGVGKWLRKWSLDELPQLINVLKGEMSLVGPRPALPREVATYEDWHRDRLEVRPGITGLWQIGGRSDLSFDDYVRLDLFYIENCSITYDLYILSKTIPAVLFGRGAF